MADKHQKVRQGEVGVSEGRPGQPRPFSDRADGLGRSGPDTLEEESKAFAESLKQRSAAAQGLEKDLLYEVPLLYGSAGSPQPHGDPGIVLAKLHRDERVRRNGGGIPDPNGRSYAILPFERTMVALAILLIIVRFSGIFA